jgi:vesicle coat complex subunit
VLDVLLVNQTTETLQNLTVEFATLGDLKVVERPPTQNVGPHDFINLQSTIKGKKRPQYLCKPFIRFNANPPQFPRLTLV